MSPRDPRHGTSAGYVAGCREQCCRDAIAAWTRHRRTRRYLYGDLMVDGTGTRRRIRALMALGWASPYMDERIGRRRTFTINLLSHDGAPVRRSTAEAYARLYDELSMRLPPMGTRYEKQRASRVRNHARKQGWPPPLAWDDIDNDPEPSTCEPELPKANQIDEVVVERVLNGENLPTTKAEKDEIMRRWIESGGSRRSLSRRMGWKEGRYGGGLSLGLDTVSGDTSALREVS